MVPARWVATCWVDQYRRLTVGITALKISWLMVSLLLCTGIATPSRAGTTKPAPPTPIDEKKVELGGTPWNPQWDEIIEKALPPEMLSSRVPHGVRRFCPRFYEMCGRFGLHSPVLRFAPFRDSLVFGVLVLLVCSS